MIKQQINWKGIIGRMIMKEQKILYFDIINGISGDMTLATLLDLGVPKQIFLEELDKLNLGKEFKIEFDKGMILVIYENKNVYK